MDELEKVIVDFNNWSQPWQFHNYIANHPNLSTEQKLKFENIYKLAGDIKLWNTVNLQDGISNCLLFLKENYKLSAKANENIANALAYDWK